MSKYDLGKEIFARSFPSEKLLSQTIDSWHGDFVLPDAVADYYKEFGAFDVNIESYGNSFFLPSLENLWNYQDGYRFHALTNERIKDWNDDWLVIADQGADPLIFSRDTETILFDYHGQGKWNPSELFPDLSAMVNSLAVLGEIIVEAGEDFTNEDCLIKETYIKTAGEKLSNLLDSEIKAETILNSFGWTR